MPDIEYKPADMISLLELQTAVDVAAKVAERVESVGRRVIQLSGDEGRRTKLWHFRGWGIRRDWQTGDSNPETAVTANFYCRYSERPVTEKYGDPDMDEYSEISGPDTFNRHVSFPYSYLITEGWEEEVLQKKRERDAWLLGYRLKDREDTLTQREAELVEARAKLEADKIQHAINVAAGLVKADA